MRFLLSCGIQLEWGPEDMIVIITDWVMRIEDSHRPQVMIIIIGALWPCWLKPDMILTSWGHHDDSTFKTKRKSPTEALPVYVQLFGMTSNFRYQVFCFPYLQPTNICTKSNSCIVGTAKTLLEWSWPDVWYWPCVLKKHFKYFNC